MNSLIELIPCNGDEFYIVNDKSRFIGSNAIKLSDNKVTEIMRKGCIICFDKRIVKVNGSINVEKSKQIYARHELTSSQFTLIAMGKCMARIYVRMKLSIQYWDNELYIINGDKDAINKKNKISYTQFSLLLKTVALHRIIEQKNSIYKSVCHVYWKNDVPFISKQAYFQGNRYESVIKNAEIRYSEIETIEERLNRWNNELLHGKLIIQASDNVEMYITIGADEVIRLTKEAQEMAYKVT